MIRKSTSPSAEESLDDLTLFARLDQDEMGNQIAKLGDQIRDAWVVGKGWEIPTSFQTPDRVIVVGVGGSAIGGDIVSMIARTISRVPVDVVRNYLVPQAGPRTLIVACSVSGDTEETLTAFETAHHQKGMKLAITGGGQLATFDGPLITYSWEGHPRSAFGWGLMPLVGVLSTLKILPISDTDIEIAAKALDANATSYGIDVPTEFNSAKQLAIRLHGRLPFIVGADFLEVAARRWAGQLQENAKQWAFFGAIPEINHNLLNVLGLPQAGLEQLEVVLLDAEIAHERNRRRVELTSTMLDEAGIANSTEISSGASTLESILRACSLGDWISYYSAILNGVDPSDTKSIETFKQRVR